MKQDSTTQDVSFLHTQIQTGRRSLESMQQLLLYGIMRRRQGIVMRIYIHCLLFSLVLLVNELSAQHISSKFISTHTFGDLSVLQVSKESHWFFHDSNIEHSLDITVSEAYYGCVKEVSYKRLVPDPTCEVVNCNYCKNKGVIFTKTVEKEESKYLEQHLQSPCPVCLGKLKAGKDGCAYYKPQVDMLKFNIPRGCRLGYQIKYSQLGNAMLDYSTPGNFTFAMGDLILNVGGITDPTKSGLNMTKEGLELKIVMKPMEALEGFTRRYDYFDEKVISIDKFNKTTLPDTELIMKDDALVYNEADSRDGLLIRFTMLTIEQLKEKLRIEEQLQAAAAAQEGQEPVTITSQEDFDAWEATKKDMRKQFKRDSIITKFLTDLKRRQDVKENEEEEEEENEEEYVYEEDEEKSDTSAAS